MDIGPVLCCAVLCCVLMQEGSGCLTIDSTCEGTTVVSNPEDYHLSNSPKD